MMQFPERKVYTMIITVVLLMLTLLYSVQQYLITNQQLLATCTKVDPKYNDKKTEADPQSLNLDGCYHVYLDVGSNRGNQVRKLFEPEKYQNASAIQIFDKYFGPVKHRRKVFRYLLIAIEVRVGYYSALFSSTLCRQFPKNRA